MRTEADRLQFHDLAPLAASFLDEVITGLSRPQKALSAKYFYDDVGARLFERICELPEYYLTRAENALMAAHVGAMARLIGPEPILIEYGSGNSSKSRRLIEAVNPRRYVPIDISLNQLRASAAELVRDYPRLHVSAVCADYTKPLTLPELGEGGRRVVYFPGSTIGNFDRDESLAFLRVARELAGADGGMLVGVDLKKNPALLHAAYNDSAGVTAEFNLNVLARINKELGADFDLAAFAHHAFYSAELGRIEMHLLSRWPQTVNVRGHRFTFRAGETIHTEISCKYEVEEFQALARLSGFDPAQVWFDTARQFSVHYLRA